jgi:mono/diheme cytochrome c family protein
MRAEPPTIPMTTSPSRHGRSVRGLASAALLAALPACSWFTDFKDQPKIEPWESPSPTVAPRGQPQGSVPTVGMLVPEWRVSYRATIPTIDSMSTLANPVAADDRSLQNGRKYYAINCAVCHGDTGAGDGPAVKYGMVPINLLTPITLGRTDGYIFGMIRNGRGVMPTYDRIEEMDRWDVVNYVRGLQGRLGRPVPTGPLGVPGETGDKLPGYTRLGPTTSVPHWLQPGAMRRQQTSDAATPVPATRADSGARPDSVLRTDSARRGTPQ